MNENAKENSSGASSESQKVADVLSSIPEDTLVELVNNGFTDCSSIKDVGAFRVISASIYAVGAVEVARIAKNYLEWLKKKE